MSSGNEAPKDASPETVRSLANGLAALSRDFEPVLKGIGELAESLQPFTETLARFAAVAAPFVQAAARGMENWDTAESLLKRGWVPNHTTPFDLITECGDDSAKLRTLLLAYYTDNWPEVRASLESRMSSHDVDEETKATFREALDAHEHGLYRCVSRLLFPEFERAFRGALFEGRAGPIPYQKIVKELTGEAANLELADFLFAGMQDMVLFKYLTEGVRDTSALNDHPGSAAPKYEPGLYIGVTERKVERARQSPIPTRHAVAHGLVAYSSQQSSLNAIFIADYVFSVVSRALQNGSDIDDNRRPQEDPDRFSRTGCDSVVVQRSD